MNIDVGVPQDSVLERNLFLLFINDMQFLRLHGKLFLYADDAAVFYPGSDDPHTTPLMNQDLVLLSGYFRRNLLTLNMSNIKCMHFHGFTRRHRTMVITLKWLYYTDSNPSLGLN